MDFEWERVKGYLHLQKGNDQCVKDVDKSIAELEKELVALKGTKSIVYRDIETVDTERLLRIDFERLNSNMKTVSSWVDPGKTLAMSTKSVDFDKLKTVADGLCKLGKIQENILLYILFFFPTDFARESSSSLVSMAGFFTEAGS